MKTKNVPMIDLPPPVAAYWTAANAGDSEAAAACFSTDASVLDEGNIHRGTAAIAGWIAETTRTAQPVVEPLHAAPDGDRFRVTARVSGAFPGSPVELDFEFTLANAKIEKLEIQ